MTLKVLYIARHGFRLNWQTTIWKSPTGFPRDPPLTGHGNEQAEQLAAYIASLPDNERPTAIYSSQYYRCVQTANPIAVALNLPIYIEPGLAEWYTPVKRGTGLHPRPVSAEEILPHFSTVDPSWTPTFLVTREGESVPGLYQRGEDFLKAFINRIDESGEHERILFVSHAATVISLSQALLGDESIGRTLRVGCCTLSVFDRLGSAEDGKVLGASNWKARGTLASADFLTQGVERDWGMVDVETSNGIVIEEDGVPGTENEEDIRHGVQPWRKATPSISRM